MKDGRYEKSELETLPPAPSKDDPPEVADQKVYALAKATMACPNCGSDIRALDPLAIAEGIEKGDLAAPAHAAIEALECDACGWTAALVEEVAP